MLDKLIAWGDDRSEALARLQRALEEYYLSGIKTNVGLFQRILAEPEFLRGEFHTRWLDELLRRSSKDGRQAAAQTTRGRASGQAEDAAALAAALWHVSKNGLGGDSDRPSQGAGAESGWKVEGRREQVDREPRR
jgi:acetyl/propionyl-CoA carboxylase alpha subunit